MRSDQHFCKPENSNQLSTALPQHLIVRTLNERSWRIQGLHGFRLIDDLETLLPSWQRHLRAANLSPMTITAYLPSASQVGSRELPSQRRSVKHHQVRWQGKLDRRLQFEVGSSERSGLAAL